VHTRRDSLADEVQVTLNAGIELANDLDQGTDRVREILIDHAFGRADIASAADLADVVDRFEPVRAIFEALPAAELVEVVEAVNVQLAHYRVEPTLRAHDGFPLHIHWTGGDTDFGLQVAVDVLMALAHTLCDDGTDRFGRCAADGCARLFNDTTKNRSRRFCSDPRCATRTHTAQHRARRRAARR
jgi:predicted RNA-binding Zn ribbon-like protein